jgi:hypothetical protein
MATIQVRRGTKAASDSNNATLAAGEIALETDSGRVFVGDGSTAKTSLPSLARTNTRNAVTIANGVTALNWNAGVIQVLTISEAKTFNSISNPVAGETITLVLDGTFSVAFSTIDATVSGAYEAAEENLVYIYCYKTSGGAKYKITFDNSASGSGGGVDSSDIIGVQDLYIPASAMWPKTTSGCANLTKSELSTSLLNIQTLDFDQTTQEFAQFTIVLPRKYNNGTLTAAFYWTASSGSGTVQWGISGGAYSNDDALTVAFGTAQTSTDTLLSTNDLHISPDTSAITLAGTPADADFLAFQISRNPASDTLSGDAKLLGVSLRITTDAAIDA